MLPVSHDASTGMPNMQLFYDRVDTAFQRAGRERSMIAIMVVNMDRFKKLTSNSAIPQGIFCFRMRRGHFTEMAIPDPPVRG